MDLDKTAIRNKIESEIESVSQEIEDLKELTKPIGPENAIGRISRMDAINNKAVNEATLRKSREKLMQLERAIQKVDNPDFGICIKCKNPIPLGRIMLMPHSNRCVNCA